MRFKVNNLETNMYTDPTTPGERMLKREGKDWCIALEIVSPAHTEGLSFHRKDISSI